MADQEDDGDNTTSDVLTAGKAGNNGQRDELVHVKFVVVGVSGTQTSKRVEQNWRRREQSANHSPTSG